MRLVGAACLTAAFALAGLSGARRLARREKMLRELVFALELLRFELLRFRRPMPELAAHLACAAPGAGGALFARLSQALTAGADECFSAHWARALGDLKGPERAALLALGSVLGRYGAEEQITAAEVCQVRLRELEKEAKEAYRRSGRLFIGLGVSVGAVVSVMLL